MRTRDSNERIKAGLREKPEIGDWRGEGDKREEPMVVELNGAGVRVPEKKWDEEPLIRMGSLE